MKDVPLSKFSAFRTESMLLAASHAESGRGASPVIVLRAQNGAALGCGAWNDVVVVR
jgi:hypothetical protein